MWSLNYVCRYSYICTHIRLSELRAMEDISDQILLNFGGVNKNDLNKNIEIGDISTNEISIDSYSPYKIFSEIPAYFNGQKNDFCVLTLNCQSLNAKYDKIRSMLHFFRENNFKIHALCLQETWIKGDNPDLSFFKLPGFEETAVLGASCGSHGGLAIYLAEGLVYKEIFRSHVNRIWEGLFISVSGESIVKPVIIGNVYKPPRDNNNNDNIDAFMSEFTPVISKITKLKSDSIVVGDTNIDLLQINHRLKYTEYLDFMLSNGFFPKISFPTKFSNQNASLYDHIFYKSSNSNNLSKSAIIWGTISDHLACVTSFHHIKCKTQTPRYVQVTKSDENYISNFILDLQNRNMYDLLEKDLFTDPNRNYEIIENTINECKEKHLPTRTVKFNKHKHKNSVWITGGILRSIQFRDKLYLKLKKTSRESQLYLTLKQNLKTYNTILNKLIIEAKKNYYQNEFHKYQRDVKKTWGTINDLMCRKNRKSSHPTHIKVFFKRRYQQK